MCPSMFGLTVVSLPSCRNGYRNIGLVKMHSGAKIYLIYFAVFLTEKCNAFGYSMNNCKKIS